jgi:hypothetical protein
MLISIAEQEETRVQTALSTVEKMLRNLADNPTDTKPRRVRMANPNFKSKVVDVEGAVQLFEAAGFAIVSETPKEAAPKSFSLCTRWKITPRDSYDTRCGVLQSFCKICVDLVDTFVFEEDRLFLTTCNIRRRRRKSLAAVTTTSDTLHWGWREPAEV